MKKIDKNLLAFTLITSFFTVSMISIIYKFVPSFFIHTVYYCKLLINSYSFKIQHDLNLIIFVLMLLLGVIFLTKTFMTVLKISRMKNYLIKNEKKISNMTTLEKKLGLENKVSIVKDKGIFAFCLGIRNPHIYISTKTVSVMTAKQLEAILLHEKYHVEHSDSLTLFIGSLPQLIFPFFPLVSKLLEHYKIEREIKADKQAVTEIETKKPIVEVLKKLLENPSISPSYISSIADTHTMEIRIKTLLNKKTSPWNIKKTDLLITILSFGLIVVSIVVPVQATEIHTKTQDTVIVCLESNGCTRQCEKTNSLFSGQPNMSHSYSLMK